MKTLFRTAFRAGAERVAGWADLLDRINVFPVADGDTGRNLVLTLGPLVGQESDADKLARALLLCARGNSGNIAAQFLSGFLGADALEPLPAFARRGNQLAWKAVPEPRHGTMLSLLDALSAALDEAPVDGSPQWADGVLLRLEEAVRSTTNQLPKLQRAGVVDSGALGMFLFFDGFLHRLVDRAGSERAPAEIFRDQLDVASSWAEEEVEAGCCIDAVIDAEGLDEGAEEELSRMGDSVVAVRHGDIIKIHLHAADEGTARGNIARLGTVVSWASDDLGDQTSRFSASRPDAAIHVVTDAAGSVTRADAARLGLTLLDSYINLGVRSVPETHLSPDDLYTCMKAGIKVSTSQASTFGRHQHYEKVVALNERALYLCVGSAYTGNVQTVTAWQREHDPDGRLVVIDSGAASGRLGLAALAAASMALSSEDAEEVISFARQAVEACREYVFLDKLTYLAAGGRLSRTSAFFGDMLGMKPVISPLPGGAEKVAVLKKRDEQVAFGLERLDEFLATDAPHAIMLEYTDNEEWVNGEIRAAIARRYPGAELLLQPFSLTSGAHMGPGTWGLAFLSHQHLCRIRED